MTRPHPHTPNSRYLIVKGRLWRTSNPGPAADMRHELVSTLIQARRAVGVALKAGDTVAEHSALAKLDAANTTLGERGPVWRIDAAPDLPRQQGGEHAVCGLVRCAGGGDLSVTTLENC